MTDKYRMTWLFRDDATRLVIPNFRITVMDAITNIVSSYVTNPTRSTNNFFTPNDKFGNSPWDNKDTSITAVVMSIIDALIIGLGVTKIETAQEYSMPFSKGIGSTGEVIHLLGAKNELINLEFKTDRYPGRLGYVLRAMLQKILETAQVVYLIDDLFLATPCLVRKIKLSKEGRYRGAIMGSLELVSLSTGGSFIEDRLGGKDKVKTFSKKLKNSIKPKYLGLIGVAQTAILGVGKITIAGGLLAGILGYGGGN